MSSWQKTEVEAELRDCLKARAKEEVEKAAERIPVSGSWSGQTVKGWLDSTNRSAILNRATDAMVDHIQLSPGAEVDYARANHFLANELVNVGTFEIEGVERKFKPR
jgi:hypothetical protein